jgi:hypothetical protein
MEIMFKISGLFFSVALSSIALTGCTFNFWYKDFVTPGEKLNAPKFDRLTMGMTKQQVIEAIGQPVQMASARTTAKGFIETWEYNRLEARPGPDRLAERYQVEFTNGRLSGYESSGDFKQQINVR